MCDSISNGAARSSPRSIFLSFVLLKDAAWCASAFAKRFRREWDDSIELEDDASSSTSCFIVDDVPVFIRLIPAPIPDNEALGAAEDNFLWRGDKSLVAHHRAHLIVTAPLPGKRAGRAFAKVCASLSGESFLCRHLYQWSGASARNIPRFCPMYERRRIPNALPRVGLCRAP